MVNGGHAVSCWRWHGASSCRSCWRCWWVRIWERRIPTVRVCHPSIFCLLFLSPSIQPVSHPPIHPSTAHHQLFPSTCYILPLMVVENTQTARPIVSHTELCWARMSLLCKLIYRLWGPDLVGSWCPPPVDGSGGLVGLVIGNGFGLVWFGLVWFGLVWFGLVWFGLVWFGCEGVATKTQWSACSVMGMMVRARLTMRTVAGPGDALDLIGITHIVRPNC